MSYQRWMDSNEGNLGHKGLSEKMSKTELSEKSSWCWNKQVCHGVNCKAL